MRNRMVQKTMFTDYRAITVSPEAKWFMMGLMVAADDDGNVSLDFKWLKTRVVVKPGQSLDDLNNWVLELTDAEFIAPYEVDGVKYASITEWKTRDGLTFQYIDKTKVQPWRNPTPAMEPNTKDRVVKKPLKKPTAKKVVREAPEKPVKPRKVVRPRPTKGVPIRKAQEASEGVVDLSGVRSKLALLRNQKSA